MVVSIKVNGSWVEVPALQGSAGATGAQGPQGIQGPAGNDYTITNADYAAIAALVYSNHMTDATNVGY